MENLPESPPYCLELLLRVYDATGSLLVLREHDVLEFDSELQLAGKERVDHWLAYRTEYRSHIDHFIVNAAYKILRVWELPPEERYIAAREMGKGLPITEVQELFHKLSSLPLEEWLQRVEGTSRFLYASIVRQLTSFPVDIRVEREIAQELPEHREKQVDYLKRQVHDFLPTLDEGLLRMIPEKVYRTSTAMNIAFAETAAKIAGVEPAWVFRRHRSREVAERLLDQMEKVSEPGLHGDRELTDAWARELGLEGWYEWVRYDETP